MNDTTHRQFSEDDETYFNLDMNEDNDLPFKHIYTNFEENPSKFVSTEIKQTKFSNFEWPENKEYLDIEVFALKTMAKP